MQREEVEREFRRREREAAIRKREMADEISKARRVQLEEVVSLELLLDIKATGWNYLSTVRETGSFGSYLYNKYRSIVRTTYLNHPVSYIANLKSSILSNFN